MSFLDITAQQQTGIQVNAWISGLLSSVEASKSNYNQIMKWLELTKDNSEYTDEDREAVLTKVGDAIGFIKTLLPNE